MKYELLAPVGSFEMLHAAINAKANAVYFGLKDFNMRDNAKNFSIEDLDEIKKICGKKVKKYLTLNTIIYSDELKELKELFKTLKGKIDAVICWDLGIINLCKKHKIPFHISTQASVSNISSAKFYKKLGAKRIVLARELNLDQIAEISKIIDVECFCHGAMCVAISGRCFTSQFLFNSSANRGKCIQPCRRSYEIKDLQEGYKLKLNSNKVMSAKDLCTLPFINKLKDAKIKSFKIEGRNRDPRYVETVTNVYRKALDKKLTNSEIKNYLTELKKVYNREFSSGFYLGLPTTDDFAKIEHSAATTKKHFIGKVTHCYPKLNVVKVKLVSNLKLNDKICVIGKTTGIIYFTVKSMEIKNKKIKKAKKGTEIGIKLSNVRKNDEVYIILNNK